MTYREIIEKYGNVKVKFSKYYKYSFSFITTIPEGVLHLTVGNCADDIYKLDVKADKEYTVKELEPNRVYLNGELICDGW